MTSVRKGQGYPRSNTEISSVSSGYKAVSMLAKAESMGDVGGGPVITYLQKANKRYMAAVREKMRISPVCTRVSAEGGKEMLQALSRSSLQPRREPQRSRLFSCSQQALYRANFHMQPWRSPWGRSR